jgi:hypothetical protein
MKWILMLCALMLAGCCSTGRCYLSKALKMTEKVDLVGLPEIQKACSSAVDKCGKVKPADCPAFVTCEQALIGYKTGMNVLGRGLESVNKAFIDAGVK